MKKILIVVSILSILAVFSCKDEVVNKPVFETLQVTRADTGATFQAKINLLGGQSADDYGFVWSDQTSPTIDDSVYYFRTLAKQGTFLYTVNNDLTPGKIYYVRAFIKSENQIIYANEVQFESLGSATPFITSFSPSSGGAEDVIVIKGDNFTRVISNMQVLIGENQLEILEASRNELKVKIPASYHTATLPIALTVTGKSAQSKEQFTLNGPILQQIAPVKGSAGTEITLLGSGFSTTPQENHVTIGATEVVVKEATSTTLTVIAPRLSEAGLKDVEIEVHGARSKLQNGFELTGPVITSFSPSAGVQHSILKIYGTGFSSVAAENQVMIGHSLAPAEIISATPTELEVRVPMVYSTTSSPIGITVKSIYNSSKDNFSVEGPEIASITPGEVYPGAYVTLHGKNFIANDLNMWLSMQSSSSLSIESMTPTEMKVYVPLDVTRSAPVVIHIGGITYTTPFDLTILSPWAKQPSFPGIKERGATAFTIGNYGYVGLGWSTQGVNSKDFWRYDPVTEIWTQVADFPGPARRHAFSFVIDGKAYVGGGFNGSTLFFDLWQYNPATDTWTKKSNFYFQGSYTSETLVYATAIGNYGYFIKSEYLHRYDPSTDTWSIQYDPKLDGAYEFAVTVGNKGYFKKAFVSGMFEFEPATNTWTTIDTNNFGWWDVPAWVINNKLYYGNGSNLFEFDPATQTHRSLPVMKEAPGGAATFSIGDYGYFVGGRVFYKFNPSYK
ncbi:IPT/TIG domain-containing protein [Pseudochryseolinea flava]|uniref:IPT/TIG domain-containing protein n=1 Tax=Pseudochryseolinea flava TaxID=2059302 RepID=A0A364Y0Z5_9BACT|nr:IPT/TIG domain-containing protein [Pseudochryseolinea flava]RAW00369.1 hypothetical protein DQQ10_15055 [Pseudochryseolinea flava]